MISKTIATSLDFEVNWMQKSTPLSKEVASAMTQSELNSKVCNIMRSNDKNIPKDVSYEAVEGAMNTGWGIARTGVQMYNGISADGIDPFFPVLYNGLKSFPQYKVDMCLGHA
jgi:hypothetical protein